MIDTQNTTKAHQVNPNTDRCVMCGRNRFNRNLDPACDYRAHPQYKISGEAEITEAWNKSVAYHAALENARVVTTQTQDGLEAAVEWTCPKCQLYQADTVHPQLGPFLSATCEGCGNLFDDSSLSEVDRIAWNKARDWAEGNQCKWTDGEKEFTGPHQFEPNGKCATCGETE